VKRCPTCNKTFTDQNLSFCVDDGTPLVTTDPGDETTVVMSSPDDKYGASGPPVSSGPSGQRAAPAYQPPGAYVPPGAYSQGKRSTWPWILGILVMLVLIVGGLGIAAAVLVPRLLRASSNTNATNLNANSDRRNTNANLNNGSSTAGNENANANSVADDTAPPPKDQQTVLADLKSLEDEWTVANINADKKKLNSILADDYVGITNGKAHGKAEYLKTIERDTAIQHWEFADLKVSVNGDRASLTGIIRLEVKDQNDQAQQVAYRFTDKFVWRDGRWQATSSEVNPLKADTGVTS
jgi:ketosteroid isomerase-like protein